MSDPNPQRAPRRFYLERKQDISGMSGTGRVAEGVQFTNGWCGMTWRTYINSVTFFPSIEAVIHLHGHNGATELVWLDE